MSKKQIRILIIVFIVVLIIVFTVFLLKNSENNILEKENDTQKIKIKKQINSDSEKNNLIDNQRKIEKTREVFQKKSEDILNLKIKTIARNFAERYGTWSTDNKQENFQLALNYSDSNMEQIINNFISSNDKLSNVNSEYYSIITKALNAKILKLENESAELIVDVQQTEFLGKELESQTKYQDLRVFLKKINDNWLVNNAQWSK